MLAASDTGEDIRKVTSFRLTSGQEAEGVFFCELFNTQRRAGVRSVSLFLVPLTSGDCSQPAFPGATLYLVESMGKPARAADSTLLWNQTQNRIFNAEASARREAAAL